MRSTFETRLVTLLKKLEAAPACNCTEAAFALFHTAWLATNEEHKSPDALLAHWRSLRLCAEHGWQGLYTQVCYRDFEESPNTRVHLHPDGSLVIQRIGPVRGTILCAKQGHPRMSRSMESDIVR